MKSDTHLFTLLSSNILISFVGQITGVYPELSPWIKKTFGIAEFALLNDLSVCNFVGVAGREVALTRRTRPMIIVQPLIGVE